MSDNDFAWVRQWAAGDYGVWCRNDWYDMYGVARGYEVPTWGCAKPPYSPGGYPQARRVSREEFAALLAAFRAREAFDSPGPIDP